LPSRPEAAEHDERQEDQVGDRHGGARWRPVAERDVPPGITIIKRDRYDSSLVQAGDEIEIVNFVGGGSFLAK